MAGKSPIHMDVQRAIAAEYEAGTRAGVLAEKYGHDHKTVIKIVARNGGVVRDQKTDSGSPFRGGPKPKVRRGPPIGERHGNWKGGRCKSQSGYWQVIVRADDEMASMRVGNGYVLEHRLVMARSLGRPLTAHETVHHINGDRLDNRLENLQLRSGKHGKGTVMRCACCGSTNVVAAPIAEAD